jgi:phospholipid transport system substrate-binding protein
VLFIILTFAGSTLASSESPTEQLKGTTDKIMKILNDPDLKAPERAEERKRLILEAVNERFDWGEFSMRAMGRYWKDRTDAEKKEFTDLFGKLLERTYEKKVADYTVERVDYLGETSEGKYGVVRMRVVTSKKEEFPVNYQVMRKNNEWFVYDVSLKGISLISNYRSQFSEILGRSSYRVLIERLKEKVANE